MKEQIWSLLFCTLLSVAVSEEPSHYSRPESRLRRNNDHDFTHEYSQGAGGLGGYSSKRSLDYNDRNGYSDNYNDYITANDGISGQSGAYSGSSGFSGGSLTGYSAGPQSISGYSSMGGGHKGPIGHHQPQVVPVIIEEYEEPKKSKSFFKNKGNSNGKHKGHHYDDYDDYDQGVVVRQPYIVNNKVVINRPGIAYKNTKIKIKRPTYNRPILVQKPVIYKTKEWRLVDVPKVTYQPAYITPVDYEDSKKGSKSKSWWSSKKGGGWW